MEAGTKPQCNEVWDTKEAITFPCIQRAALVLPYASSYSVMFQMLARTGMRVAELNQCFVNNIKRIDDKYVLFWCKGKNQTGMRREELSLRYMMELKHYREQHNVPANRLFSPDYHTFTRMFNRFMRPEIGREWTIKRASKCCAGQYADDFDLQFKGLRKTFVTFDFARNLLVKKMPEHMALCMTARRMGHNSEKTTGVSYVVNFDKLEIERWVRRYNSINDIIDSAFEQKPLLEFIEEAEV